MLPLVEATIVAFVSKKNNTLTIFTNFNTKQRDLKIGEISNLRFYRFFRWLWMDATFFWGANRDSCIYYSFIANVKMNR